MTGLLILLCIVLIAIVAVQVGKVTELAGKIRGEEDVQQDANNANGLISMIFLVVFLVGCVISAGYYKNWMLGYGPHTAASEHGGILDHMFDVTLVLTGIVFVITHIALFWFAYKYRGRKGRKALFFPHNNTLEIVWTVIPAVVMTYLVVAGLDAWNTTMADVTPEEEYIEIEATGIQFNWLLRYGGPDGKLGTRNYKKITGINPLGQEWEDVKNLDDLHPSEIVLPVGKKVRVRIIATDVLHNFYLPHFRVKMDAIPGIPTYFVFTPTKTTEEYRQELRKYPDYHAPMDAEEPDGPTMWEGFEYELACAELCGKGHFSMRRLVKIVSQEEYEEWLSQQTSWYMQSIRNTDNDPYKGQLLDIELMQRERDLNNALSKALNSEKESDKILRLDNVNFETGSAILTADSKYELNNLVKIMNRMDSLQVELGGHTDNTGDAGANLRLSDNRAVSVREYLIGKGISDARLTAKGYGQNIPISSNDTDEGRAENRRTEFKIIAQ